MPCLSSSLPFTTMSSPSKVEHILSPALQDTIMPSSSPPVTSGSTNRAARECGVKIKWSPLGKAELLVFKCSTSSIQIHCHWFLSRTNLLNNIYSAQKDEDGNILWVEFTPQYHSHLVKCAVALCTLPCSHSEKGDVCIYFGAS